MFKRIGILSMVLLLTASSQNTHTASFFTENVNSLCTYVMRQFDDIFAIPYDGDKIPLSTVFRHLINSLRAYNFNQITDTNADTPRIMLDTDGTILSISDGMQSPIYVSSFPRSKESLQKLRSDAHQNIDALIGLYTLNTEEEQEHFCLARTLADDGHVINHAYPTIDFKPPTIADMAHGVYDLSTRAERAETIACIHCKAGIGRSITMAAAYLLYVYTIAEIQYTDGSPAPKETDTQKLVKQIVQHIKVKRPVAHPNREQKAALEQFYSALREAGSLENLYLQTAYAAAESTDEGADCSCKAGA